MKTDKGWSAYRRDEQQVRQQPRQQGGQQDGQQGGQRLRGCEEEGREEEGREEKGVVWANLELLAALVLSQDPADLPADAAARLLERIRREAGVTPGADGG
jgi:hypothetical protein